MENQASGANTMALGDGADSAASSPALGGAGGWDMQAFNENSANEGKRASLNFSLIKYDLSSIY